MEKKIQSNHKRFFFSYILIILTVIKIICVHFSSVKKERLHFVFENWNAAANNNNSNNKHFTQQNLNMAKKRKLQERNRISLNGSTNNAIRTYHIKARIDKTQQNSKCRLCSDRDETINHIISECSKLA